MDDDNPYESPEQELKQGDPVLYWFLACCQLLWAAMLLLLMLPFILLLGWPFYLIVRYTEHRYDVPKEIFGWPEEFMINCSKFLWLCVIIYPLGIFVNYLIGWR